MANGDEPRRKLTTARTVWLFLCVIGIQTLCAGLSLKIVSGTRVAVQAESLWSKSVSAAVYFLARYTSTGSEDDFRAYQNARDLPDAFRRARVQLERPDPDQAIVHAAFSQGLKNDADSELLTWLEMNFRTVSFFRIATEHWYMADEDLQRLGVRAEIIRAQAASTPASASRSQEWIRDIEVLNSDMRDRAHAFSDAMGEASRMITRALWATNGVLAFILAALTVWRVRRFITDRRAIELELLRQASIDPLTGAPNRRAFEERLRAMEHHPLVDGQVHALVLIDLDQFKVVNDTCGHAAGDGLLRVVCRSLQEALNPGDLLARLGGDEFGVVLIGCDPKRPGELAETLRASVQTIDFTWGVRSFRITASVGLACSGNDLSTPDALMRAADMACYMAKEKGRNRVHVHDEFDADLIRHAGEMDWAQRIRHALDENRFCLYAQLIAPLAAPPEPGLHVELLLRMRDEAGGIVPPGSFLPAAERFGLMTLIDRWVVRAAFETLAARLAQTDAEPVACCAINLSGATIGDETFRRFLEDAFSQFRIPPHLICFEITETCAVTNLQGAERFVRDLRQLGCRFSLDDFGSGMSSFGYLKQFPVDFLKIDGVFVKNLLNDQVDRAMVESIKEIGHVMGKHIIAEFVESAALAEALQGIGVDYGQGYGIARPEPFEPPARAAHATPGRVLLKEVA